MNRVTSTLSAPECKLLISVVLPSYNDEPIIRPFYQAILKVLEGQSRYDFELIYVDDGSTDGSQTTLAEIASSNARVTYIELFRNFGQQRALFAGLSHARGDVVITLDGDFQYEPQVILQLADAFAESGCDVVSGVRDNRQDSWFGRLSSWIGNQMIRRILNVNLKDFGSVKAYSRQLVDRILGMRHYYSDVYPAAFSMRPTIREIDVKHLRRPHGVSHWDIWMRIKLYIDLYISYSDSQFNMVFKAGVVLTLFAGAGLVFVVLYKALLGHQASYFEIVSTAYQVGFTGALLAGWALLMSFVTRIYKQNMLEEPFAVRQIVKGGEVHHRDGWPGPQPVRREMPFAQASKGSDDSGAGRGTG
ncbi:MAG: glycosyltransferase family 2 protein [Gammaproteobacteria bacterium]|nr:glycosyltransferase family 2 protein [Gammaproteobacteria bacterium]